jgi:hypothetical protein
MRRRRGGGTVAATPRGAITGFAHDGGRRAPDRGWVLVGATPRGAVPGLDVDSLNYARQENNTRAIYNSPT